jgi:2-aminoadipate transaminase
MSTAWTSRYALRTRGITSSQIRELLKITQRPGMISFAGGLPAPEVFPIQRFEEACHKVLTQQAASALQYGTTKGYEPLRELIADNMGALRDQGEGRERLDYLRLAGRRWT